VCMCVHVCAGWLYIDTLHTENSGCLWGRERRIWKRRNISCLAYNCVFLSQMCVWAI
jgi:hypothetical protein